MSDYEWLADQLMRSEFVENGPQLEKGECQKLLDSILESTGKTYMLIVNVNIERSGVYYDYVLAPDSECGVHIEEWDNRYL